jgi:hypothetical protein
LTVLWFSWFFWVVLFAFCVPVFGGFDGFRGFFPFSFSFSVSWVRGVSLRESRDKDGCTERQRRYARLLWALNGGALDALGVGCWISNAEPWMLLKENNVDDRLERKQDALELDWVSALWMFLGFLFGSRKECRRPIDVRVVWKNAGSRTPRVAED